MLTSCITLILSFVSYSCQFSISGQALKLELVQMIYRHGDRSPIHLYPNDPNPLSVWPRGLNALSLLGKRQHFALGKLFRSMYENFTTSNPLEVDVLSSAIDRCLESAAANLASFYAPSEAWQFQDEIDWQPIPIHYLPTRKDKYIYYDSFCPRADMEKDRILTSPPALAFFDRYKESLNNLTLSSGSPIKGTLKMFLSAFLLRDALFVEKLYNLTIPEWVEPHWNALEEFSDSFFYWWYKSPVTQRLRAGPLLKKMIKRMTGKIKGNLPHLKFQIFSGHDATLAVILHSLNLLPRTKLAYCTTLIFEFYSGPSKSHFLRLLYLNSTEPERIYQTPHTLKLDGCEEFCPFEYFVNYTRHLIPDNWKKECKLEE